MPKNSVVESFTVAFFPGTEKVWIGGGGEYQDFPSKILCLTVRKSHSAENIRWESFTVALTPGTEKVWRTGG